MFEQTSYGLNNRFSPGHMLKTIILNSVLKMFSWKCSQKAIIPRSQQCICGYMWHSASGETQDSKQYICIYIVCETGPWCRACLTMTDGWLLVGILMSLVKAEEFMRTERYSL